MSDIKLFYIVLNTTSINIEKCDSVRHTFSNYFKSFFFNKRAEYREEVQTNYSLPLIWCSPRQEGQALDRIIVMYIVLLKAFWCLRRHELSFLSRDQQKSFSPTVDNNCLASEYITLLRILLAFTGGLEQEKYYYLFTYMLKSKISKILWCVAQKLIFKPL